MFILVTLLMFLMIFIFRNVHRKTTVTVKLTQIDDNFVDTALRSLSITCV